MRSWYGTSATQRTPAIRRRVTALRQRFSNRSDGKWNRASPAHGCCRLTGLTLWIPNSGSEPDLVFAYARTRSGSDPELVQVWFFEKVVAVAGVDCEVDQRRLAQDLERNDGAGGTQAPDAPPQVGEPGGLRAGHFDHDVAHLYARAFGGRAGCDSGHDEL